MVVRTAQEQGLHCGTRRPGCCPPLGAHLSVAGGVWRAVERAAELECDALQIFTQAPSRWTGPPLLEADVARFGQALAAARLDVRNVVIHAPYLINLAARDRALRRRSVELLVDQLVRADRLGVPWVVLHPGAHTGDGVEEGVRRVVDGVDEALGRSRAARLLLEMTAGQGSTLGSTFAELGEMLALLPRERTGTCWDTAHLWAAGVDLASETGYQRMWHEFEVATGRQHPDVIHLNDTGVDRGARRDRHERIGFGVLGPGTFARILNDSRLADVPMVLETPKGDDQISWDREALALLRSLLR